MRYYHWVRKISRLLEKAVVSHLKDIKKIILILKQYYVYLDSLLDTLV
jgi:hypothetical protein